MYIFALLQKTTTTTTKTRKTTTAAITKAINKEIHLNENSTMYIIIRATFA